MLFFLVCFFSFLLNSVLFTIFHPYLYFRSLGFGGTLNHLTMCKESTTKLLSPKGKEVIQ